MTNYPKSDYKRRILGLAGDGDIRQLLTASRDRILGMAEPLNGKMHRSYGPDKWNARQILCHLADVEMVMGFRLRQALAEDDHQMQVMDENRWARRYDSLDPETAMRSFRALRDWNLALVASLTPEDLSKPAFHPERGPEPVGELIKMLAGHDRNHLSQLEQIATS